ncbi:MAG: DUF4743 domain-containing protein [Rhodospirillaceae bacterium]|nr:DUF4743 domain-containing protein [Rhodospirillaceae bacterium]
MSYLDRIRACNTRDVSRYRPFLVGGQHVGFVRADMAEVLSPYVNVFAVADGAVALDPRLDRFETRTAAVDDVLKDLKKKGILRGWRNEPFPVVAAFDAAPLLAMERAAVPLFGVRAYGVHMNGYVWRDDALYMWVGHRSKTKPTYPGMLDNTVAGGLPYGMTARACLAKECEEEASIPASWAQHATSVGAITYCAETAEGLRPDVQFCYDLELPEEFTPVCRDGEIERFELLPIEAVAALVRDTERFKFNCNLVIIDFLVRQGLLGPEDPDYVAIVQGLHQ